jgi:hypothetical protein
MSWEGFVLYPFSALFVLQKGGDYLKIKQYKNIKGGKKKKFKQEK